MTKDAATRPARGALTHVSASEEKERKRKAKERRRVPAVDDSNALAAIHDLAEKLYEVGGIDQKTMREYDDLCIPPVPDFTKAMIAKIRKDANVSQSLFAKYLNTSPSTVQKWETGAKKPSGAAARLLQVVKKHGIEVLA
ncbi:putative zinc finger/helix-turn-helix protein, YgiT family [Achromobacter spanius]|jgi:putative transcriptional regulator|nr:transcriptional regulator [Achromobacter spanius]CAB3646824.1 hypothetical protein LMG5911_02140 [Achromobacter spanius]SPT38473.1 putative zinc finger/helix-turn-helix protein, YgiT family [Achromobacter denitrificans]VEE59596.1 putative zinc finger/helix-turn-helix protein, YgiT family [Achromobacter spanius]